MFEDPCPSIKNPSLSFCEEYVPGGEFSLVRFYWPALTNSFTNVFIWLPCQLFSKGWKTCYSSLAFQMSSCFVFCQFLLHLSCRTRAAILFFPNAFNSKDSLAHQSHLHNPCPYRAAQERRAPQITSVSKLSDTGSRTLLVMSLCVNQYVNEHIKVCPTRPVHKNRVTGRLTCCLVYAVPRNIPLEAFNIFLMMKATEANSAESPPASKDRCSADSYLNKEQKFTYGKVLHKFSFQFS